MKVCICMTMRICIMMLGLGLTGLPYFLSIISFDSSASDHLKIKKAGTDLKDG